MVSQAEARLKEAAKLGFSAAALPLRPAARGRALAVPEGLQLWELGHLSDLVSRIAGERPRKPRPVTSAMARSDQAG